MNIFKRAYLTVKLLLWRLSAGMVRVEEDILKPKELTDTNEKNKHSIKAPIRNKTLAKMDQGVKDQKFVDDYYEILKKGDDFLEKSDPEKIAQVAGKHGMNMGKRINKDKMIAKKDEFGRRYDHYGFFDPKHKHYGKTIREITVAQVEERKLKDDDYPIEYMINNTPIVVGMGKDGSGKDMGQMEIPEQAKRFEFPLRVIRERDVSNKIEQLAESLHVKRIDETHRILEFLIPKKYGLANFDENSKIVKEIIDFNQIWHKEKYGSQYGFTITGFYKKTETDDYDVIKLRAILIAKIK